jgi:hypothetical protein
LSRAGFRNPNVFEINFDVSIILFVKTEVASKYRLQPNTGSTDHIIDLPETNV